VRGLKHLLLILLVLLVITILPAMGFRQGKSSRVALRGSARSFRFLGKMT